jgi:hypothetical protein
MVGIIIMLITETHKNDILGTLYCYDRVIINGTAGSFGYADGMTTFFNIHKYKIFDFANIFTPITEQIKLNAEKIAKDNGIEIEYIRKTGAFRKDDKIDEIIKARGEKEGIIHIFSALEMNKTYAPWHDKAKGRTYFKSHETKCLTYYFYFIDKEFGLCFVRVPTIAPYKIVFYFNGHNWLESKLKKNNTAYQKLDNAFIYISDYEKAQNLSDKIRVEDLHQALDIFVARYCPLPKEWDLRFNYTISQVEYSIDILFKDESSLKPLYDNIIKTAMHTVTPDNIANFLGKRFSVLFEGEAGSRLGRRILGTRIKHQMGEISVKIYDKFGKVLRIEITSNDVSQLKVFRDVHKRNGSIVQEVADVKKSIYSLFDLISIFKNACNRYLEFVSSFDDPLDGMKKLDKVTDTVTQSEKNYKGFNFYDKNDERILLAIADGKFNLKGITNKELRKILSDKKSWQISRILLRLRLHGIIKKVGKTYKYYLSSFGKQVIAAGLSFKNITLIPALSRN